MIIELLLFKELDSMNRLTLIKRHLTSSRPIDTFKSDIIKIESHNEAVKIVRLNNVSKLNALSENLINDLHEAMIILERDPKTKVIVLTGNEKVFCAGADISMLSKLTYTSMIKHDFLLKIEEMSYNIGKPIIAAVSGFCFGGGFELALACDIIGAVKGTKFGFPEIKLGLFPGAGGTQRLSRVCGYYKASEVIMGGEAYDADTVKSWNVVNFVQPDYDSLMKNCLNLAEKLASYSMVSLRTTKRALKASQETTLRQGLDYERNVFYGLFSTEDKKIGTEAFLNKKKPVFKDN